MTTSLCGFHESSWRVNGKIWTVCGSRTPRNKSAFDAQLHVRLSRALDSDEEEDEGPPRSPKTPYAVIRASIDQYKRQNGYGNTLVRRTPDEGTGGPIPKP